MRVDSRRLAVARIAATVDRHSEAPAAGLARFAEARERRAGEILLKAVTDTLEEKKPKGASGAARTNHPRGARDARKGQSPEAAALRHSAFASANVPIRRQTACGFSHR
jgi:hypothetical protein